MTPELQQLLNGLIQVLLLLLGGGVTGGAVARLSKSNESRNYKALFQEATEELVEQHRQIEELKEKTSAQDKSLIDIKARLTILNDEREIERKRYQTERDEVMMERGRISAQVDTLKSEIEQMRADLKDLRAKNDELQKVNKQLEEYREVAREQKRQLDEANKKLVQYERDTQGLKDHIRYLESQINPPPPPPHIVDPRPKASGE